MDVNALINLVLQAVIAGTKQQQEDVAKHAAQQLAAWVKSSETTIDDTLVKQVAIPNIDIFVAEFKAAMA